MTPAAGKASKEASGGLAQGAPYLPTAPLVAKRVWFETYGCQMNFSDTEVARSILEAAGHVSVPSEADADGMPGQ
jgi:hypothetical protein